MGLIILFSIAACEPTPVRYHPINMYDLPKVQVDPLDLLYGDQCWFRSADYTPEHIAACSGSFRLQLEHSRCRAEYQVVPELFVMQAVDGKDFIATVGTLGVDFWCGKNDQDFRQSVIDWLERISISFGCISALRTNTRVLGVGLP